MKNLTKDQKYNRAKEKEAERNFKKQKEREAKLSNKLPRKVLCVSIKQEAFEKAWDFFTPMREKREELIANPDYVESVLQKGAEKARNAAQATMTVVREAVGLR